jgi:hypothetical protein
MREGLIAHTSIFVNETLSFINPQHLYTERFTRKAGENSDLDDFINTLISQETLSWAPTSRWPRPEN